MSLTSREESRVSAMNDVFRSVPRIMAVPLVERYEHKKFAGTSDTAHIKDE